MKIKVYFSFLLFIILFSCKSNKEVKIGSQIWMNENLNVDKFQNGDPITEAKTEEEWKKAGEQGIPAWCHYINSTDYGIKYGKLYNYYAVNDSRGLAPKGWHVPSDSEWNILYLFLGIDGGKKLKVLDQWGSYEGKNGSGTDDYSFNALPSGRRTSDGYFDLIDESCSWWSSTNYNNDNSYVYYLHSGSNKLNKADLPKSFGYSVRCLKD
jgi:uncharacterized protein (TIGR02145 family)